MAYGNYRDDSELESLVRIITTTREVLELMVESKELLFRSESRKRMTVAWEELAPRWREIEDQLSDPSDEVLNKLRLAGLTGAQLEMKVQYIEGVHEKFREHGSLFLLRRVLSALNKLLGSLLSAVPGVEAVKEYKDYAESELDESENEARGV